MHQQEPDGEDTDESFHIPTSDESESDDSMAPVNLAVHWKLALQERHTMALQAGKNHGKAGGKNHWQAGKNQGLMMGCTMALEKFYE